MPPCAAASHTPNLHTSQRNSDDDDTAALARDVGMIEENWRSSWVAQKCDVASALNARAGGAGYSEAVLILCAVLSAMAADAWPGRGIDRRRFTELVARFEQRAKLA